MTVPHAGPREPSASVSSRRESEILRRRCQTPSIRRESHTRDTSAVVVRRCCFSASPPRRRRLGKHQAPPPDAVQHVERYPPSTTGWESRVSDGHERGRRDWAAARTPGRGSRLPRSRGRRPAVSLRPPRWLHRLSWRSPSKDRGQFPVVTSRTQPGSRRRDRLLRDRLVVISSGGSARPGARRSLGRPKAAGLAIAAVWPQMTFPHAGQSSRRLS